MALSGIFRKRSRSVRLAVGLNAAAAALVGAVLTGLGPGWADRLVPLAIASASGTFVGALAALFPRSVALPLLAGTVTLAWLSYQAVADFRLLSSYEAPRAQPLTDRETVTLFAWRADFLEPPEGWEVVPPLYRLRPSGAEPAEWWWSALASRGWARSVGAPLPRPSIKFGVYRLVLRNGDPLWVLEAPELAPPR